MKKKKSKERIRRNNPDYSSSSDEKEKNLNKKTKNSKVNSSESHKKESKTKLNKKENKNENIEDYFAAPLQIGELTPNGDDLTSLSNYKIINLIGDYLKIFLKFGSFFPEFQKDENTKLIKKYIEKYSLFFNIKRFSIPCFGTISCGKSSFLNYLLKLHKILETDEDIATKFVCFIRHVKGLKKPKIYNVRFEQRDIGKFNFEKGEELEDDVKKVIKERNKYIREGNGKRDPTNYFLIVEADIPLFHGENEKYSPYFEFLDFPGLDEVKAGETNIKDNTYFKDFLPLIQPNIMFSLFLFDLNSYESESGKAIFKNYIFSKDKAMSEMLKGTLYNSIYILNQIDKELKLEKEKIKRIKVKENRENHFREKMKENFEQVLKINSFNFNKENSLSISAKILELEEYKFESFPQFIEYIISLEEMEEHKNFKNYLEKKLKDILNISFKNDKSQKRNSEITEEIEEELENVNEILSNAHLVGSNFN